MCGKAGLAGQQQCLCLPCKNAYFGYRGYSLLPEPSPGTEQRNLSYTYNFIDKLLSQCGSPH